MIRTLLIPLARVTVLTSALAACSAPGSSTKGAADFQIGAQAYPYGDVIHLDVVESSTGDFESGAEVVVRGRYDLRSADSARLLFSVTSSTPDGAAREATGFPSSVVVDRGRGEFELGLEIVAHGYPHVTYYERGTGKPFGGVYFGSGDTLETNPITHYATR